MPELPEVETIARALANEVLNLEIESAYVFTPAILKGPFRDHWPRFAKKIAGSCIQAITRRGKRLIIVTNNNTAIIAQLGMTGKFFIRAISDPNPKHTHFQLNFSNDKKLIYNDVRRFGRLWPIEIDGGCENIDQAMIQAGFSRLAPDPFQITPAQFRKVLQSSKPIKNLLLDQQKISGLGNIYTDESLFAACIHPETPSALIEKTDATKLLNCIRSILKKSIAACGTTFRDFQNPYGDTGSFKNRLKVYRKTNSPCSKCKTPIQRIVLTGRSTHFCPHCQKPLPSQR
ncbi:MAG: bifunctional DNA-formamidopyrimidine glycosylase/DNA-(apurinic or apyrimidinic site) lyase [Planctomycetes bacterium]|nr:bifunctional DNA-formamidopyrimidine glycosylase/DNA-(apurinic or apyrimidinic site) lyase [Planctomycetota bacterium]